MNRVVMGVVLLVIIAIGAVGALAYFNGGTLPNLQSLGQKNSAQQLEAESATLEDQGQLLVDLQNNGQRSTSSIQVLAVCSPDYTGCQDLDLAPATLVLPTGSEFDANLSLPQCDFIPYAPCGAFSPGAPVPGQTYYFEIRVTFDSGNPAVLEIPAKAFGTTSFINQYSAPIENDTLTLTNLDSASLSLFGNLTGRLSVTFTIEPAPSTVISTSLLNATSLSYGFPVRNTLASASTGACSPSCPNIIGSGGTTAILTAEFSTVTTGVVSGNYYLVSIDLENYGSYYLWMAPGSTITGGETGSGTSNFSCSSLLPNLNVTVSGYVAEQGEIDLIIKNSNSYSVTFWGIDPIPYAGTTISVNQTIPAMTSRLVQLSNPAFEVSVHGIASDFNFYFIPTGANEHALASQGNLCTVPIKLVS